MLDFAVSKGADRAALLEHAELREGDLRDQDDRVTVERYLALLNGAAELTNEPAIAAAFGKAVRIQDISIVGLICEACETTIDVAKQLNRYAALIVDDERCEPATLMRGTWKEGGVWIEGPSALFSDNPQIAEAEFSRLIWNARVMFKGSPEFEKLTFPHVMHFKHDAPPYRDALEKIFEAPLVFGSDWNAMLIDPEFLALKQPPVSRYVFGVLSDRADALLKELEQTKTTRGRVESLVMPILHTGDVTIELIAGKLNMDRQGLYRQLKSEDVTFEQVMDDLRHELALRFLGDRNVSVNQTAYLLGYSEPAAFSRAFKRWTGISPRTARAAG